MKKVFFFLAVFFSVVILQSCSKDDDTTPTSARSWNGEVVQVCVDEVTTVALTVSPGAVIESMIYIETGLPDENYYEVTYDDGSCVQIWVDEVDNGNCVIVVGGPC